MENYSRYYQIIGHNIALYRKKKGLTQEGLALKANISRYVNSVLKEYFAQTENAQRKETERHDAAQN